MGSCTSVDKKSSRIIVELSKKSVIEEFQGKLLQDDIYYTTKNYHETKENIYALIFMPIEKIRDETFGIDILRKSEALKYIPGIENLNDFYMGVLDGIRYLSWDDKYVLLTIEPREDMVKNRVKKPTVNLCIPGGRHELEDKDSRETALRELYEETGIKIKREVFDNKIISKLKIENIHRITKYYLINLDNITHSTEITK